MGANWSALQSLGITHILNCSINITCFHILRRPAIKYARIPLDDISSCDLYQFMEAAACFIDECNPHSSTNKRNKILVHCAAGVSRSASVVMAYLISRRIEWTETERRRIDVIREHEGCAQGKDKSATLILNEAYYLVKSRRECVYPNDGFLKQLGKFEELHHDEVSTLKALEKRWLEQKKAMFEAIDAVDAQRDSKCHI